MIILVQITVEPSLVKCDQCSEENTFLVQIEGQDEDQYIGGFLCKKHFEELIQQFRTKLKMP
jgi:hypothetical protein